MQAYQETSKNKILATDASKTLWRVIHRYRQFLLRPSHATKLSKCFSTTREETHFDFVKLLISVEKPTFVARAAFVTVGLFC